MASKRKAELHLERRDAKGAYYVFVVDVLPMRRGTRMQVFFIDSDYEFLVRSVIGWARGTSQSCPDLARAE